MSRGGTAVPDIAGQPGSRWVIDIQLSGPRHDSPKEHGSIETTGSFLTGEIEITDVADCEIFGGVFFVIIGVGGAIERRLLLNVLSRVLEQLELWVVQTFGYGEIPPMILGVQG